MTRSLVVFSPLPPSRSGIADYCLEQLPELARHWDTTVVIADEAPDPASLPDGIRLLRHSRWQSLKPPETDVIRLYHSGNNPHHAFVFQEARQHPGVVVLHDHLLHHLVQWMTVGQGNFQAYSDALVDEHGDVGRRLALLASRGLLTQQQLFGIPLNRRLIDASTGIIVHSSETEDRIRHHHPGKPVAHVPHHYAPPPEREMSRQEARLRLGLAPGRLIIASLGFITPAKQIPLILGVLARLAGSIPDFEFWLVGHASEDVALRTLVEESGLQARARYTGFLSTEDFYRYIAASDLVVNLRYPTAGETSGTLVRAMGMGTCCVVFDYDSFADYPDSTVIKVPLDTEDSTALTTALRRAASSAGYRAAVAAAAASYVGRNHDLRACVARYTEFLRSISRPEQPVTSGARMARVHRPPGPGEALDRVTREVESAIQRIDTEESGNGAVEYARTHARRVTLTLAAIAPAAANMAALEIGSYQIVLPHLRHALGFDIVAGTGLSASGAEQRVVQHRSSTGEREPYDLFLFNAEADRFPFPDRSFDLVLACEVIEHLAMDPLFMMSEINRVLKFGGAILLTTPNVASARGLSLMLNGYAPYLYASYNRDRSTDRHNIEYDTHAIEAIFRASGFDRIDLWTEDCWSEPPADVMTLLARQGFPTHLRGDNIFATGTKVTELIERFPPVIYGAGERIVRFSGQGPQLPRSRDR